MIDKNKDLELLMVIQGLLLFGTQAVSETTYYLGKQYAMVRSDVGIDSKVGNHSSVVFQVYGDGVKIYDSGVVTGGTSAKSINVNVTGVSKLRLVVTDGGDGIDNNHADWAN